MTLSRLVRTASCAALCALSCSLGLVTADAHAQSGFTYQGVLNTGGTAATGPHDFIFRLFDQAASGAQIGPTITLPGVQVTDGQFSATLDFSASAFDALPRFLEIAVRPAGGGAFTTLAPRQSITAAPVAIRSLSDRWRDLGSGTLTNTAPINRVMINRTTPITGSDFFTVSTPTAPGLFGGMYINTESATGKPFYGFATSGAARSWMQHDGATGVWSMVNNLNAAISVDAQGRTGVGMVPATPERLQVAGDARINGALRTTAVEYNAPRQRKLFITAGDWVPTDSDSPVIGSHGTANPSRGVNCTLAMFAHAIPPAGSRVTSVVLRTYNCVPGERSYRGDLALPASTTTTSLFTDTIPVLCNVQTRTHTFNPPLDITEGTRLIFTVGGSGYPASSGGSWIESITVNYEVTREE